MTEKETAEAIIKKHKEHFNLFRVLDVGENLIIKTAKNCARSEVQAIINASPSAPIVSDAGSFVNDIEESTLFWKGVLEYIK